ncbi:PQQ-dependent dehydrogenase, methanol/ethanol family, partial [Methylobacterium sp. SD274]|nr:PQQ-dependent dehydrogenase, methanol/ethanol family [Methylobacterium sp. SD274]
MRDSYRAAALLFCISASGQALADEPVLQTVDYANTRYSKLDQINASNVKQLQVAWTFSTGVLRGHEGSPLVIGNMMYV